MLWIIVRAYPRSATAVKVVHEIFVFIRVHSWFQITR